MSRTGLVLAITVVLWATSSALIRAQQADDPVGAAIGFSKSAGSIPPWSKPSQQARQELGEFVRNNQYAVMLVGHPKHGRGTAWVLSKKHRLLVTNAHVADIMHPAGGTMLGIVNGDSNLYKVSRAWYHPGVRRIVSGKATVKSADPKDGEVDPSCPDVALIQLSAEGADLPTELKMSGPGEFGRMLAQPAAMFGYPGHDTKSWPQTGETAEATYHDGVISRVTNFHNNVSVPLAQRQFVQYTMSTWGGFSGSPVFLPSGEVIAVNNSAQYIKGEAGDVKVIPHGVRIDCVWELIVHHGLQDLVPLPVEKSAVDVERWLRDDPEDLVVRKAMTLVSEASDLIYTQKKHAEGVVKCTEAIKLAPGYAKAYDVRCDGYVNYWFKYRRQIDSEAAMKQLIYAEQDAIRYNTLEPSNPWGVINIVLVYNNGGQFLDNDDLNRKALTIVSKLLQNETLPPRVRAAGYSNRAIAYDNLDEDDAALRDHNEAVRLDPTNSQWLENRADFWHYQGREDLEEADYAAARRLK